MDHPSPQQQHAFDVLVSVAFEKSWRFVEKDPFLTHNAEALLRARLRVHLERSLETGEKNVLHLANNAIWNLRTELGRQPGSPGSRS
ncbi:hypothetical protein [Bradyrhizobium iriomotense]|uniref:Uncharacterized protein n=1 Tax=Bradyrhizobium iriomotense TaxID=441950 RepID=A0ABQ6B6F7_9BRAD|nr:hypothetical protein [Bradyrhizobium iriomotense]GLR89999.1 hypothetical protein GCM10007857_67130 [Bradyrhizobium iriomotense]